MATSGIKISKLVTDPEGFDRLMDNKGRYLGPFTKLNEEYIELYNDSNNPADVSFWYITDPKDHRYVFIPQNTTIGPHKTLTLHTGSGVDVTDKLGYVHLYWGRKAPIWNNRGDTAILYDNKGKSVSKVSLAKIYGYVYDKETNKGINHANINDDLGNSAITNPSGYYELATMPGQRTVTAAKEGYNSSPTESIKVVKETHQDFYLEPIEGGAGEKPAAEEKKEVVIDLSVEDISKPNPAHIKQAYNIIVTYKNNKDQIDYFESHLFEDEAEADDYNTKLIMNNKIVATYQLLAKNWDWYALGLTTGGYVQLKETEKKFKYEITYFGKQGYVRGELQGPEGVGVVKVVVPQGKIDATVEYNNAWTTFLGATAVGVAVVIGAAIPVIGQVAAGVFGGAVAADMIMAQAAMNGAFKKIEDPIEYDKHFRQICELSFKKPFRKIIGNLHAQAANKIVEIVYLLDAKRITINRLYSAQIKGAGRYIVPQLRNLKRIEKLLEKRKKELVKFKKLRHPKLSKKEFKEVQACIGKKGLPKQFIKDLLKIGVSRESIKLAEKVLPKLKANKEYLNLAIPMRRLITSLESSFGHTPRVQPQHKR